jgi:hypothetical protein
MSRRTKDQAERDRGDLLLALEEDGSAVHTHVLIARVLGYASVNALWEAYPRPAIRQAMADLQVLKRQGRVVGRMNPGQYQLEWRLATAADLDDEDDAREVARLYAGWQEADS